MLKKHSQLLNEKSISAQSKKDMISENDLMIDELMKIEDLFTQTKVEAITNSIKSMTKEFKSLKNTLKQQHQQLNTFNKQQQDDRICVIEPNEKQSYAEVVKCVRDNGNLIDDRIRISNMITTKSGKVLAKCRSKEERDKLINNCRQSGINVREIKEKVHRFYLTRLPVKKDDDTDYTDEELINELLYRRLDTDKLKASFKLIKSFTAKNDKKTFIFNVKADAARSIIEDPDFYIGTDRFRARLNCKIKQCYKCQAFGHMSENCPDVHSDDEVTCTKCSEKGHWSSNCSNKIKKCINCIRSGKDGNGHYAMSDTCPLRRNYRREEEEAKADKNKKLNKTANNVRI